MSSSCRFVWLRGRGGGWYLQYGIELTLLHSERPKLYGVLAILSAIALITLYLHGHCTRNYSESSAYTDYSIIIFQVTCKRWLQPPKEFSTVESLGLCLESLTL